MPNRDKNSLFRVENMANVEWCVNGLLRQAKVSEVLRICFLAAST